MEIRIKERADNYVRIAISTAEKKIIKDRAKELGLTITDYIKTCINKEMRENK